jgi:hypothetical protein
MVTSTSTPASMLMMICLTTSVGALRLCNPPCQPRCSFHSRHEGANLLNQALVDAHLILIPGLGTLTVGGLTGHDLELLGGQTDGALDAEVLGLGAVDELLADLLEGLDLARGEGDADLVEFLRGAG